MIKYMRKLLFIIVVIAAVLANLSYVFAADTGVSIDAIDTCDSQGKRVRKVYPGDEFYIVVKTEGDNSKEIKAIYGSIEYDENTLEIVDAEDNPIAQKGWKATGINKQDNKFFFHTQIKDAPETVGYIRVRVKANAMSSSKCVVSIKNVNLYKESGVNSFGELTHDKYNADVTLRIGSKTEDLRNIIVIVASVVVLAIIVFVIWKDKKKKMESPEESIPDIVLDDDDILNSEDSLVMQSKDNRAEIQAKMRAVLDEVKKNKAEKEEKKKEEDKVEKKKEVNEASNTDEE